MERPRLQRVFPVGVLEVVVTRCFLVAPLGAANSMVGNISLEHLTRRTVFYYLWLRRIVSWLQSLVQDFVLQKDPVCFTTGLGLRTCPIWLFCVEKDVKPN